MFWLHFQRRGLSVLGFPFGILVYFRQSKRCLKIPGGEQDCAFDEDSIAELGDLNGGQQIVVAGACIKKLFWLISLIGGRRRRLAQPRAFFLVAISGDRRNPGVRSESAHARFQNRLKV
ncbi:hypothetical protein U1Q18_003916 [Sarracenia purpurea var. burkii]